MSVRLWSVIGAIAGAKNAGANVQILWVLVGASCTNNITLAAAQHHKQHGTDGTTRSM